MNGALLAALLFALACAALNAVAWLLPPSHAELLLWRRLNVQALRRRLTKRRGGEQPLSVQTIAIAKRNIAWHVAMSLVMATISAQALFSRASPFRGLALLGVLPCIAWLIGSAVQRQKIAVVECSGRNGR
jgi:hypothetical protein